MPVDVCSSNSSGQKRKPQPLPGSTPNRGVNHAAVYGDAKHRNDQDQPPIGPLPSSSTRGGIVSG
jgi:hypothetical protein